MSKYEAVFPQLLSLVEKGHPISKALTKVGLCRRRFYVRCPKRLMSELLHVRATKSLKPATNLRCAEFSPMSELPKAALLHPFGEDVEWEDDWSGEVA